MRLIRMSIVIALVAAAVPAGAADLPPGGSFLDDDSSVHEGDIEALAAAGITKGCNPPWNDEFCPEASVTRGEMAAFLTRALELPQGEASFDDTSGSVFAADIASLAAAGITRGCNPPDNDLFCPERAVTRGEMAAFLTRAYGYEVEQPDRFVDDDASVFEADIDALAAASVTQGCNPPDDDRFCPYEEVTRQQMASFLTRAEGLTPMEPPVRPQVELATIGTGFTQPVHAVAPPGDDRIFVSQKNGVIRILQHGDVLDTPFLDISDRVANRGEMGLLSIAFHPDYPEDDRVFVYYSNDDSGLESRLSSFRLSPDPNRLSNAETRLMTIDQPATNHNGGHLLFGPDGLLYVALGDGGGSNDPNANGQDPTTLLGSLLRIDVSASEGYSVPDDNPFVASSGRDEIWALGLRNPWRVWFDDGLLYVADVGQGAREEINVVAADRPLVNYGWSRFEGRTCNQGDTDPSCATDGFEFPDVEYRHGGSECAVTGGVVYRGDALPWLRGHYFYGDLCAGWTRSFRTADGVDVDDPQDWTDELGTVGALWSYGVDGAGEILVLSGTQGTVSRIQPAP